jgi:hypothetical protein
LIEENVLSLIVEDLKEAFGLVLHSCIERTRGREEERERDGMLSNKIE